MTTLTMNGVDWEFKDETIQELFEQLLGALQRDFSSGQWTFDRADLTIHGVYQSAPVTIGLPRLEAALVKVFGELKEDPLLLISECSIYRPLANFLATGDTEHLLDEGYGPGELASELLTYVEWR